MNENTWLQLCRDVRVVSKDGQIFVLSEDCGIEIDGDALFVGDLLDRLSQGHTLGALEKNFDMGAVLAVVAELLRHRLVVVEAEDRSEGDRNSQMFGWLSSLTHCPATAQTKLAQARVCVIGVGGLGGQVLEHLVGAGVGSIVFADGDRVTRSNLNRQYQFSLRDLGLSKTAAMEAVLRDKRPDARFKAIDQYLQTREDFSCLDTHDFDLLINCADTPTTLGTLAAGYASHRSAAYVSAGMGVNRGFWGPLFAEDPLRHMTEFEASLTNHLGERLGDWNCSTLCKSSNGPYNSVVAAMLAADALLFLSDTDEPRCAANRCYIDFHTLQITSTKDLMKTD